MHFSRATKLTSEGRRRRIWRERLRLCCMPQATGWTTRMVAKEKWRVVIVYDEGKDRLFVVM